jgi:hypothetical protein
MNRRLLFFILAALIGVPARAQVNNIREALPRCSESLPAMTELVGQGMVFKYKVRITWNRETSDISIWNSSGPDTFMLFNVNSLKLRYSTLGLNEDYECNKAVSEYSDCGILTDMKIQDLENSVEPVSMENLRKTTEQLQHESAVLDCAIKIVKVFKKRILSKQQNLN